MERVGPIALGLLLVLSGCLGTTGPDEPGDTALESAQLAEEDASLDLEGEDCTLAGGHSVHPRNVSGQWHVAAVVPDPWRVADVIEDVGPQVVYSEIPDPEHPVPEEGETWGHYHATLACGSWTLAGQPLDEDLIFGFVGPKVETPAFAPTRADNEYLATVITTSNEEVYTALQRAGYHVMWAVGGIESRAPGEVEVYMRTDHNGEYLSIFQTKELGDLHAPHMRLWAQHENVDGTYQPRALEMHFDGGTHYGAQGQGYFHHARTGHHYPLPGAYGKTAAFMVGGTDVTFEVGPHPDVVLEEAYDH